MATIPGTFAWYELFSPDPDASFAFYGPVTGWTKQLWEEAGYPMIVGQQGPLGGVLPTPEWLSRAHRPPTWIGSVNVADADAVVAKTIELGGSVLVPTYDLPKIGRLATIVDPRGAAIAIVQPEDEMPPHDRAMAGEIGWHELITHDHATAFTFYRSLFHWEKTGDHDMGPMGHYTRFGVAGQELGGMFSIPKGAEIDPAWLYYTRVADLDVALSTARAKGATVLMGPHEVPSGDRIVQLVDPQGARFALFETPR